MNFDIERESVDQLHKETWRFRLDVNECALVLDWYQRLERPTLRHKYRDTIDYWRWRRHRLDEIPLPEDVAAEAMAALMQRLKVTK